MDVCCIHYDSTEDDDLLSLSSIESWITLLEAAKLINYSNTINVAADLKMERSLNLCITRPAEHDIP